MALASLGAASCMSMASGARETFAERASCPEAAVVVRARPDIRAHEILLPVRSPSAEVRDDPTRLAKWREDVDREASRYDRLEVWEATGCGRTELLACERPARNMHSVSCRPTARDSARGHAPSAE